MNKQKKALFIIYLMRLISNEDISKTEVKTSWPQFSAQGGEQSLKITDYVMSHIGLLIFKVWKKSKMVLFHMNWPFGFLSFSFYLFAPPPPICTFLFYLKVFNFFKFDIFFLLSLFYHFSLFNLSFEFLPFLPFTRYILNYSLFPFFLYSIHSHTFFPKRIFLLSYS